MTPATKLLHRAHIMTLATATGDIPWAAAVYYIPHKTGLYFFSSPTSRHIRDGIKKKVAATIHESPFHISEIEGFQMRGTIEKAGISKTASIAFASYIKRFDFLNQLFSGHALKSLDTFLSHEKKVSWYRFKPHEIWYIENQSGFGTRVKIDLEDLV
ncbi:MAG: pyridoxamine 5'-phosphate oxidase family protein [Desulfobacterales bacterium]|nr:pyridoxamine 5'-phosphate oxidase family protein [Desulfobacterales bacterium]